MRRLIFTAILFFQLTAFAQSVSQRIDFKVVIPAFCKVNYYPLINTTAKWKIEFLCNIREVMNVSEQNQLKVLSQNPHCDDDLQDHYNVISRIQTEELYVCVDDDFSGVIDLVFTVL